eukprot:10929869-Heterocapsa_arctica.AAC.1
MVIARMPEDRSKTIKNLQTPSSTCKAIHTCMCTPVGPTEYRAPLNCSGSNVRCESDGDSESPLR